MYSKWDDFKKRRLDFYKYFVSIKKRGRRVEKYVAILKLVELCNCIRDKMAYLRRRKLLCRYLIFFIVKQHISFKKLPLDARI